MKKENIKSKIIDNESIKTHNDMMSKEINKMMEYLNYNYEENQTLAIEVLTNSLLLAGGQIKDTKIFKSILNHLINNIDLAQNICQKHFKEMEEG